MPFIQGEMRDSMLEEVLGDQWKDYLPISAAESHVSIHLWSGNSSVDENKHNQGFGTGGQKPRDE